MRSLQRCRSISGLIMTGALAALFVLPGPSEASAQTPKASSEAGNQEKEREAARAAYTKATQAFDAKNYETAYEQFKAANDLIPTPHAQYWMAQSLDMQGKKAEALSAYETFLYNEDSDKVGEEKVSAARARVAELRKQVEAEKAAMAQAEPEPEPPPVVEPSASEPPPEPAVTPLPLPPPSETSHGFMDEYKPEDNLWEFGLFGGPLFVSRAHNLHEERFTRRSYTLPAWLFGVRAGYFPLKYLGAEVEYAHGFGSVQPSERSASFNTFRGLIVGQLPLWRFVPYASLGAGGLHATSDVQGSDLDFLFTGGLGAKLAISEVFTLRLDFREDLLQRQGGGISFSEEILLGLGVTLGR